jgi:hypothetical protein
MSCFQSGTAALDREGAKRDLSSVTGVDSRTGWPSWAWFVAIASVGLALTMSGGLPAAASEPTAAAGEQASAMATTVAVLHWQGEQGAANLARVSDVKVPNLLPTPAPTVDTSADETAVANAAATATASASQEIARSVQATVAASATASAIEAAALEETREAGAKAEATAAAQATQTARASAAATRVSVAANATVIAAAVAATREAELRAAAAVPAPEPASFRLPPLLLALVPVLGGLSGLAYWRTRKEPFVLKANAANA